MKLLPRLDHWRGALALCLVLVGCQQALAAALIQAKAWGAPILIERAWRHTLNAGGEIVRPWPWADTWPVARLSVKDEAINLLVLAGDSGNALAFGPGLAPYSSNLGRDGVAVIAGHRDTHFNFLQNLRVGDVLDVRTADGTRHHYVVDSTEIIDSSRQRIVVENEPASLQLVTCYPFYALRAGGPLRYVVRAVPKTL